MAIHTITIYAKNDKPTPLTIIDDEGHHAHTNEGDKNLQTVLQDGDTLMWVNDGLSDITSIDDITQLKNHLPVFDIDVMMPIFKRKPELMNDGSGNWSAELKIPGPNGNWSGVVAEYTITYTINGKQHTQDPKLQIKKRD